MPQLVILKTNATLPATAPEWWRLIPAGEVFILGSPDPIRMDEEAAASVIRNFEHMGRDLVIDYEHQTLKDMEAPAAGWIKAFEWRPDGLW
ncbi:phage protease, partial [Desulfosarcina sp. OttesenSCG-928-G10]|nr:phage protease [Desulfosarcina sp. OttesenSCG-928-G10]